MNQQSHPPSNQHSGQPIHQSGEPAGTERRVSLREKFARLPASSHPFPRVALAPPPPIDAFEGAALLRARTRAAGISRWMFVTATAVSTTTASVLAVIVTLAVMNQDLLPPAGELPDVPRAAGPGISAAPAAATPAPTLPVVTPAPRGELAPAAATPLPISLRPIGSPDQPLKLEPQRPAPLPLLIEPDGGGDEPFILTLTGAPAGTILFGASRIGSDTWLLSPDAASRIEIVMPEWSTQVFEIAVALRRTSGAVAAQTTAFIVVPPPGGTAPVRPPADDSAAGDVARDLVARNLLTRAERLIARGDVVGARTLYQRAAEMGNAPAALALGTTYDPNRLWSLGVLGIAGNRERARQWYLRAGELGNAEAKARLTALGP